ncbi:MAG: Rne/Rng family ribonuclease [Gemmatimonadota bacterium]
MDSGPVAVFRETSRSGVRREILISASSHESRVALLENGKLAEFMFDRPDQGRMVGDVFLGRVEAVLPGIQAAFVDIGTEKAGFLHISDIAPEEDDDDEPEPAPRSRGKRGRRGRGGDQREEASPEEEAEGGDEKGAEAKGGKGGRSNGRPPRRARKFPPIQDYISKGDTVLVQVTKEPISTKGPRLTKHISLPGRFLVYMPYSARVGVSRKIGERSERGRLRALAKEILPKDQGGIIVRTVGEDFNQGTFQAEFNELRNTWLEIEAAAQAAEAPARVHRGAHLVSGIIRDLFSDRFERLTVDSKEVYNEIRAYVQSVDPDLVGRVKLYQGEEPLFDKEGVEEEIQGAFQRRVDLPSGGYIVIEPTEALVSIDVNTGRFTGKGKKDPEETILKTNLDAAREIARQLRLRDVGGIVVCDFIDMEQQKHRDKVLHELRSHLGRDRARTKTFELSALGLIEMTRQRVRPPLFTALTEACSQCGGKGRVYTPSSVLRSAERAIGRIRAEGKEKTVVVRTHPEVVLHLMEEEPDFVERVQKRTRLRVEVRDDPLLNQDEFRLLAGPAETDVTQKYAMDGDSGA